jgi:hypothetical protein
VIIDDLVIEVAVHGSDVGEETPSSSGCADANRTGSAPPHGISIRINVTNGRSSMIGQLDPRSWTAMQREQELRLPR